MEKRKSEKSSDEEAYKPEEIREGQIWIDRKKGRHSSVKQFRVSTIDRENGVVFLNTGRIDVNELMEMDRYEFLEEN